MVLLAQDIGMAVGEYAFIFFYSIPGDPMLGDYFWKRDDELDSVGVVSKHCIDKLSNNEEKCTF